MLTDCVRLCCSLCLLENDPSVIEPGVLSNDRERFEASSDDSYMDKANRHGKIGWNVGRQIEVAPHYRRPHMARVWIGRGRFLPGGQRRQNDVSCMRAVCGAAYWGARVIGRESRGT